MDEHVGSVRSERGAGRCPLVVAMFLVVAGVGAFLGSQLGKRSKAFLEGPLEADPGCLDFGAVWEQQAFPWSLLLHNRGTEDMVIEKFYPSCHCANLEPENLTIPPGESAKVALTLDLREGNVATTRPLRDFAVTVFAQVAGMSTLCPIEVRGRVRMPFQLDAPEVRCGTLVEGQAFPKATLAFRTELRNVEAAALSPGTSVALARRADGAYELSVHPNPRLAAGSFRQAIVLKGLLPDGTGPVAREIPVIGNVEPEVQCLPGAVALGPLPVGSLAQETLTLRSYGRPFFVVIDADKLPKEISLRLPPNEGPHTSCAVRFEARVDGEGYQETCAVIHVRTEGRKDFVRIPVSFNWYAVPSQKRSAWVTHDK